MKKTIAILGASGSIGSWLSERLVLSGAEPRLIVRGSAGHRLSRLTGLDLRRCAFDDPAALAEHLQGCDVVINCVIDKDPRLASDQLVQRNVDVTTSIMDACQQVGVKRVIHLSSIVVVPPRLSQDVRQNPWRYSKEPDWYTKTKIATEQLVQKYRSNLELIIVRPGIVYGPMSGWSTVGLTQPDQGIICLPNDTPSLCHLVHIDDVAGQLIALAQAEKLPAEMVYSIHPEHISWHLFFQAHGEGSGVDPQFHFVPTAELLRHAKTAPLHLRLFSWMMASPMMKYLVQRPLVFRAGRAVLKRLRLEHLISAPSVTAPRIRPLMWPSQFRLDQYLSDATFAEAEVGQNQDFRYRHDFQQSVPETLSWWRYDTSSWKELDRADHQLFQRARQPLR